MYVCACVDVFVYDMNAHKIENIMFLILLIFSQQVLKRCISLLTEYTDYKD